MNENLIGPNLVIGQVFVHVNFTNIKNNIVSSELEKILKLDILFTSWELMGPFNCGIQNTQFFKI